MPDFSGSSIDHVNLAVSDVERSRRFYEEALGSIGITLLLTIPAEHSGSRGAMLGFGSHPKPFFWVVGEGRVGENTHVAFTVEDRAAVHAFHAAAVAAGGRDNGAPGIRTMYHPSYYGAFVLDPDGINVEAVCHAAA
jgi:catechol 2,3-dioxygenase-like lactoylglutathione lyase family enzyme